MTELQDDDRIALIRDGWRVGSDQRWRNDRFGGAYKTENALRRIGSRRGEATRPMDDEETARFLKGYAAGANDMEAGRLVTDRTLTAEEARAAMLGLEETWKDFLPHSFESSSLDDAESAYAKLSLIANGENDG